MLDGLKKSGSRVDIFTFLQKLPETTPKYNYPMEMDNLAVLPVSTFDNWWNNQIRLIRETAPARRKNVEWCYAKSRMAMS